jgi:hypothetical protein
VLAEKKVVERSHGEVDGGGHNGFLIEFDCLAGFLVVAAHAGCG